MQVANLRVGGSERGNPSKEETNTVEHEKPRDRKHYISSRRLSEHIAGRRSSCKSLTRVNSKKDHLTFRLYALQQKGDTY